MIPIRQPASGKRKCSEPIMPSIGQTEGGGLYLYDYKENVFTEKNQEYQLSADMIGSIEEDRQGCRIDTDRSQILVHRYKKLYQPHISPHP